MYKKQTFKECAHDLRQHTDEINNIIDNYYIPGVRGGDKRFLSLMDGERPGDYIVNLCNKENPEEYEALRFLQSDYLHALHRMGQWEDIKNGKPFVCHSISTCSICPNE